MSGNKFENAQKGMRMKGKQVRKFGSLTKSQENSYCCKTTTATVTTTHFSSPSALKPNRPTQLFLKVKTY